MARDFLWVGCEAGHDWVASGGANAGCGEDCCCSVPVRVCRRCDVCDYGNNDEAMYIRRECAERRELEGAGDGEQTR